MWASWQQTAILFLSRDNNNNNNNTSSNTKLSDWVDLIVFLFFLILWLFLSICSLLDTFQHVTYFLIEIEIKSHVLIHIDYNRIQLWYNYDRFNFGLMIFIYLFNNLNVCVCVNDKMFFFAQNVRWSTLTRFHWLAQLTLSFVYQCIVFFYFVPRFHIYHFSLPRVCTYFR